MFNCNQVKTNLSLLCSCSPSAAFVSPLSNDCDVNISAPPTPLALLLPPNDEFVPKLLLSGRRSDGCR